MHVMRTASPAITLNLLIMTSVFDILMLITLPLQTRTKGVEGI